MSLNSVSVGTTIEYQSKTPGFPDVTVSEPAKSYAAGYGHFIGDTEYYHVVRYVTTGVASSCQDVPCLYYCGPGWENFYTEKFFRIWPAMTSDVGCECYPTSEWSETGPQLILP